MLSLPSAKGFGRALFMTVLVLAAIKLLGRYFPAVRSVPILGEVFN